MSGPGTNSREFADVLDRVLELSAASDWRGHDKHDGLNSPILWALCGWSRPTRLLALQGLMRFPLNLRPLLRVPRVHNPKGLALFMQALIRRAQARQIQEGLSEAGHLCELLETLRSPAGRWSGQAWGYQYPWQDLGFFAPRGMPNAVVTCFVCEALLDLHAATGSAKALWLVQDALPFLLRDLPVLHEDDTHLCLGYMPVAMSMRVMDVSILIGALLARVDAAEGASRYSDLARRLVRYVVDLQTPKGAWWYTDPPDASPVRIDNYHSGFILDALWRYMRATGEFEWMPTYRRGLNFYAEHLFEADGAPRWMSDQRYPHDVHGSAQGILTFCRHPGEFPGLAERIAAWATRHLYDGTGAFWYRQTRWRTRRTFFLRWNNGWMARALSDLLLYRAAAPAISRGAHHA